MGNFQSTKSVEMATFDADKPWTVAQVKFIWRAVTKQHFPTDADERQLILVSKPSAPKDLDLKNIKTCARIVGIVMLVMREKIESVRADLNERKQGVIQCSKPKAGWVLLNFLFLGVGIYFFKKFMQFHFEKGHLDVSVNAGETVSDQDALQSAPFEVDQDVLLVLIFYFIWLISFVLSCRSLIHCRPTIFPGSGNPVTMPVRVLNQLIVLENKMWGERDKKKVASIQGEKVTLDDAPGHLQRIERKLSDFNQHILFLKNGIGTAPIYQEREGKVVEIVRQLDIFETKSYGIN